MVCSVVSNLPFAEIIKIMQRSIFMKTDSPSSAPIYLYPTLRMHPIKNHFIYHKEANNSALLLHVGFRTCGYYSNDKYPIKILKHVLNGFSGRLFTAFRTKRGLTYHSSAQSTYHEHGGYFNFFIQTDPTKLLMDGKDKPGIIPILVDLIVDLIKNGITAQELIVAKGNCKGKLLIELQDIDSLTEYNGINAVLQHNDVPFQRLYETHIEPITCAQVHAVIRKYIVYDNLVVGIVHSDMIPKKKIESLFCNIK
jgi:predicted Zn-dependent peptidase